MGCTEYEDSLQHYARCPIIRNWAGRRLRLHFDPREATHIWALTAHSTRTPLLRSAFMVYATHRAANHFRRSGTLNDPTERNKEIDNYLIRITREANGTPQILTWHRHHHRGGPHPRQKESTRRTATTRTEQETGAVFARRDTPARTRLGSRGI